MHMGACLHVRPAVSRLRGVEEEEEEEEWEEEEGEEEEASGESFNKS